MAQVLVHLELCHEVLHAQGEVARRQDVQVSQRGPPVARSCAGVVRGAQVPGREERRWLRGAASWQEADMLQGASPGSDCTGRQELRWPREGAG